MKSRIWKAFKVRQKYKLERTKLCTQVVNEIQKKQLNQNVQNSEKRANCWCSWTGISTADMRKATGF